jgi:poly(3-hydroxybutyrate) depolymerase
VTGVRRILGTGGYHDGERWMVATPVNRPAGCPLVVVCHGAGADGWHYTGASERQRWINALARSGMVVIAADLGSVVTPIDGWGNDTAVARVDEVIAWGAAEWSCDTARVFLIGDSAGGATALNWSRANPARLAAAALRLGVTDIEGIYQDGAGNALLVALIDEAYAGDWPAARATHDPALNTAELAPLADRLRFYYSEDDDLIPPADTIATAAAIGCRAVSLGEVQHDPYATWPDASVSAWLWSHVA